MFDKINSEDKKRRTRRSQVQEKEGEKAEAVGHGLCPWKP